MKLINKLLSFFKEGSMSGTKVSSKRIIMYTFTVLIISMICVEALFNLLLMIKWFRTGCPETIEFKVVFSLVIYGYIFGLISALATANAWSDKDKKKTDKSKEDEND